MKTHIRTLLSLFISATSFALAQPDPGMRPPLPNAPPATITGRVEDSELNVPVEYANVVLYRQRDSAATTGTVTRADGSFVLTGLRPGRYRVEVSFIGYRTWSSDEVRLSPGESRDLGLIKLQQRAVAVEGTEVTAERPRLEFRIDKKIVNVAQNPSVQSGTAVDALENTPGIKVDAENNVTLRGSSNFTVLIDGRPTLLEGSEALQQIPASTIENIEIITNPSAKYDPEGIAGIINVILKKRRQQGLAGMLNLTGGLPERYGGNLLLNLRSGIATATLGVNFDRMYFPGTRTVESWTRSIDTAAGQTDTTTR
ncbi:MAG: carboxypeptidase regulatory-like domain-containing protein, partial [candidate division WOR-3 bacterium]